MDSVAPTEQGCKPEEAEADAPQRVRCLCSRTGKWFSAEPIGKTWGACPHCDAWGHTDDDPAFDAKNPQYHPQLPEGLPLRECTWHA